MKTESYIDNVKDGPEMRDNYSYDFSYFEKKHGVSSASGGRYNGTHPINSDVVNGISPSKKREIMVDHTPRQIKEPDRAEKFNKAKKKYKIKGIDTMAGTSKPDVSIGKNGLMTGGRVALKGASNSKNKLKAFLVSNIIEEEIGKNEDGPSSRKRGNLFDWMRKNLQNPGGKKSTDAENEAAKSVNKLIKTLFGFFVSIIKLILKLVIALAVGSTGLMLIPILIVVICCVVVIGFICLVVGIFYNSAAGGVIAVDYIDNKYAEIVEVATTCDQFSYNNAVTTSANVMSVLSDQPNADDILLVYLSLMSNIDDVMEGEYPFILMDKKKEEETLSMTISTMISYSTETIKRKKYVTEFLGFDKDGHAKYKTYEVEYEIKWLYLSLSDANSENAKKMLQEGNANEMFTVIKEAFVEMGYSAGGGGKVCSYFK